MAHWLFKSEAETWSWDDQLARGPAGQEWDGVRNATARTLRARTLRAKRVPSSDGEA